MRDLVNPYDVRRYLNLWTIAAFETDGGGGGDDSGGGGDDSPGVTTAPTDPIDFTTIDLDTGEQTTVATGTHTDDGFTYTNVHTGETFDNAGDLHDSYGFSDDDNNYYEPPGFDFDNDGVTGEGTSVLDNNTSNPFVGHPTDDDDYVAPVTPTYDPSDDDYNTSTSTETTTSTGGTTDTYVYDPDPGPTYYYDSNGNAHTSNAARDAANDRIREAEQRAAEAAAEARRIEKARLAEIARQEDLKEARDYVQERYGNKEEDSFGFVRPAYASTNDQPIYGMNTAQDSRGSIDAREIAGQELGFGTPAAIAAEKALNNITNPQEMFPDEAYDALMGGEDYTIDDLLPPLPVLSPEDKDKPETPKVDYSGNIYAKDSPYFAELKAKQGTGGTPTGVDTTFPLGRSEPTGTGGAFATGIGTMVELLGNAAQVAGEAVSPQSARVGYSAYESPLRNRYQPVDPRLAEAVTGKKGATALPTGFEKSDLTLAGEELRDVGSRLENRAMQNMPKDARDAMNRPIITVNDDPKYTDFPLDPRPAYQIDPESLKYNVAKTIPSIGATIASVPFGAPVLAATGAVLTGGETAMEARDAVEAEAIARGYSEEVAKAMGNEASKIAGVAGMPVGMISNLAFAKLPPAGGSLKGQVVKNAFEEAISEGYVEQNVSALAEDVMTGTDKFGKAFSKDEFLLGGIGGAVTTGIVGGAQTPETTTRQIGTEERNLLPPPSSFTTDTTPSVGQEFRGGPQVETGIGSMSPPVNTDTAPSAPSTDTAPDAYTQAEKLMMQQLEDQGSLDVTDYDGLGLTLDEVQSLADSAISKKMDNDATMLRALAEEEVIQTGGLSAEMNDEIRSKLPEDTANDIINNAITHPFHNNLGESRLDTLLRMEQENALNNKPPTLPGSEQPFTPTGIETALGAAPSQESGPSINQEQQLELLLDEGQEQQLDLMDQKEDSGPTIVVEDNTTTDPATNTEFVLVEDPNTQQDLTVTVPITEEVTTTPTTSVQPATVDVEPDEEEIETEDPVVEVEDDDDDTVRPITTVTDDGRTITECPEGYRMVEGTDGPYCVIDLTQSYTRQRAGRGIEAYTGIATKGQKGPGQKKKTVTKTTQKRRPVVTRRV